MEIGLGRVYRNMGENAQDGRIQNDTHIVFTTPICENNVMGRHSDGSGFLWWDYKIMPPFLMSRLALILRGSKMQKK